MLYSHASNFIEEARRLRKNAAELLKKEYPKTADPAKVDERFRAILDDEAELERLIQRACLELRLGCEKAAYEIFERRKAYYNHSYFDGWQADQIIAFISNELDENLAYDSSIRFCESGSETIPDAWARLGDTKGINKNEFKSLYQSLGSFLHIQPVKNSVQKFTRLKDISKALKKIDETIAFFDAFRGKSDFFTVKDVVEFTCICGESLKRPFTKLQTENFVECSSCSREWRITGQDENGRWVKEGAAIGCHCPSCAGFIPIPRIVSLEMIRDAFRARSQFRPPETGMISRNLICQNPECNCAVMIRLGWMATN